MLCYQFRFPNKLLIIHNPQATESCFQVTNKSNHEDIKALCREDLGTLARTIFETTHGVNLLTILTDVSVYRTLVYEWFLKLLCPRVY